MISLSDGDVDHIGARGEYIKLHIVFILISLSDGDIDHIGARGNTSSHILSSFFGHDINFNLIYLI